MKVKHLYHDILYYLGLRKHKAYYGRYNYAEKVEYLAVVWGTIIMAITGFMMWNPIATTRWLPGEIIPAAKAAHGGEAVLAVLAIIIWHFYHVHLRHFNKSMFNGKMSEKEMAHEHPAELDEIKAGIVDEPPPAPVLRRRQRVFVPVAAVLTLVFSFGIYGFITLETTAITTVPPASTVQVFVPVTPTPRPTPTPAPSPTPGEGVAANSWEGTYSALFRNRCSTCHGQTSVGGLSLATYQDALDGGNSGPGIVPGNPEDSHVVIVQQQGGHPGQLTDEELQQVIEWIERARLNDEVTVGVLTPMQDFFTDNIIGVFFFYGLAFFSMGLAVLLEISHSSELDFAKALKPLAVFGLVHGSHEWFEMGVIIRNQLTSWVEPDWVFYLRLFLLGVSFLFLVAFGANLILGLEKTRVKTAMLAVITLLWVGGLLIVLNQPIPTRAQLIAADVYTRYSLAIPGAVLTTWGLLLQRKRFINMGMISFGRDVTGAAVAFALYGGIGQLFASTSSVFPFPYINSALFLSWFGIPIQVFRAITAILAAFFIIRSLRAFDEENRRRIQALSEAQKREQQRLRDLQAELLRRTVQAQELERQRIARELHDETGQTLTALGLGLSGLTQNITSKPSQAVQQAQQLRQLAGDGLVELQRLVSGLHPPQLDELGLAAALRWYAQETNERFKLPVTVTSSIDEGEISDEVKLTIFRIAQEAITNTVRHAHASWVKVDLESRGTEIWLTIQDDGRGFNIDQALGGSERNCLGLLGMIERANLIGGTCRIRSSPGEGTTVEVQVSRVQR